jgi:hypothetical protein
MDNTPELDADERAGIRDANREERNRARVARVNHFVEGVGRRETARVAREAAPPTSAMPEGWSVARALRETEGPSDSDLSSIESGSESAGVFTPSEIAKYRQADAMMNPQAAAVQRARNTGFGSTSKIPVSEGLDTSIDAPTPMFSDAQAQADSMNDVADIARTGEVSASEGAADIAWSDDTSGRGRRFPAAGMGGFMEAGPGISESPFTRIKESGDVGRKQLTGAGLLMLREAGRCNAPGCQLLRATGMQLTGQNKRAAGAGIESEIAPIPAVHEMKSYYPEDPTTGKQDRKNPKQIVVSKPADPNNPEYKAIQDFTGGKSGPALFTAEDMLEHNHDDEMAHLTYVQGRIKGLQGHLGEYND